MKNLTLFALPMLAACGLSEEKFAEEYAQTFCDKIVELDCGTECVEATGTDTTATATGTDTCEYDAKAAKDCLNGEWVCTDFGGGFLFPEGPAECLQVYVCTDTDTTATATTAT